MGEGAALGLGGESGWRGDLPRIVIARNEVTRQSPHKKRGDCFACGSQLFNGGTLKGSNYVSGLLDEKPGSYAWFSLVDEGIHNQDAIINLV